MSQSVLSGVQDSESKTANILESLGLLGSWNLVKILRHAASSLGQPITNEACQAVCNILLQGWGFDDLAKLRDGGPAQILRLYYELKAHLTAKSQAAGLRKTCRLLDRRKGGALRPSEAVAQQAKSLVQPEGSDTPLPVAQVTIAATVQIVEPELGALGIPESSYIGSHCYCHGHQVQYSVQPEVIQFLQSLKQQSSVK